MTDGAMSGGVLADADTTADTDTAADTGPARYLSWVSIVRLGLVQAAIGAIVVLTTSTLNRVMVVELGLAALIPGALVGWHYMVQLSRPRWGHGSDQGGQRTPWILGGMAVLALGGVLAAYAAALANTSTAGGLTLSVVAFTLIGVGVGAAGTSLLALLAIGVAPKRRPAAASLTWIMMIVGFVVTAGVAAAFLDPFSFGRLVTVTAAVSLIALSVAALAVWGVEKRMLATRADAPEATSSAAGAPATPFREALRQVLAEPTARRFTAFVFVAMVAYSMQDLILEPFAGLVFGYSPGESTALASVQHGGVLAGMVGVACIASLAGKGRFGSRQSWTIGGCLASAVALVLLAIASVSAPTWPLQPTVFLLGVANGAFAVAAVGAMLSLAGQGRAKREGVRMGVWGAAQAVAFAAGGFIGAAAVDGARQFFAETPLAFAVVFSVEACVFIAAAILAARVGASDEGARAASPSLADPTLLPAGDHG